MMKPKNDAFLNTDRRMWSKVVILFGMSLYLIVLIVTGNLTNYINLRFAWLAYVGAGIFFLLGLINLYGMLYPQTDKLSDYVAQPRYTITWKMLVIVAFPLILAIVIPSRPLGVEAVNGRISLNPVGIDRATTLTRNPLDRNVLDWLREFSRSDAPAEFNGLRVDVIGFVYRAPNFSSDDFMVSRFTISCCVADAYAIGLPVSYENARDFSDGTWVRVLGELRANDFGENFVPVIYATSVEMVEQPAQPYLYP